MPATSNTSANPLSAIRDAVAVTKSDATIIPITRGIWVGGTGDVAVRLSSGNTVTFSAVPVGTLLQVECDKVMSANTTATLMLAVY